MLGFHNTDFEPWHELYCRLTGMNIPWSMQRLYQWELFSVKFTQTDLRIVIKHIKKRIAQKRRYPESLAFRNLVGNLDRFAEDLAEAKAENRTHTDYGKSMVLRATGRPERTLPVARPAGEVVQKLIMDLRASVQ